MRVALILLLLVTVGVITSCADMPLSPQEPVTLEGSVLDRDGEPLQARLYFRLAQTGGGPFPIRPDAVETGDDGSFTVQLPKGDYEVFLYPTTYGTGLPSVTIPHFKVDEGTRLDYRYSGVYVSGRVIGPGGSIPPQAYIYAYSTEVPVSVSAQSYGGQYRLLVQPGRYHFDAVAGFSGSGLPRLTFDADISTQDTTIDLDFSGHEVKVNVTLLGIPLSGAEVMALREGIVADSRTDISGSATLYLPTGGYSFRVQPTVDGVTGPEEMYQLVQGDGTVSINLTRVAWDVTVRRQSDLSPVISASVGVEEIGDQRYGRAQTDGAGKFRMLVQPGRGHFVRITLPTLVYGQYPTFTVGDVASSADSTFDLLIDAPPLP